MPSKLKLRLILIAGCSLMGSRLLGLSFQPSGGRPAQAVQNESQAPSAAPSRPSASTPSEQGKPKAAELSLEERADIYMARKVYDDAVEYYTRALKQSGMTSATLWNKLGIAQQQQVHYRPARKAYNEAIRRRKDFAEPWNNLGTVYYLQNRFRKSIKYYQQAIRLNPAAASFHLNLGTSYYHLKKIKEAVDEYRRALQLDPNCLTEHSASGTVVQARGADVDFYFYLAKVFASLGRSEDALRYLRRAFEDGLDDLKRVDSDPDLQKISHEPAYLELRKNPPMPIKD